MANVKRIEVEAVVPFNYLEHLRDKEKAILAEWFLAPSLGVRLTFAPAGYEPSDHGGQTALYRLTVSGEEAVRFATFDLLVTTLKRAGARVSVAECVDVEAA